MKIKLTLRKFNNKRIKGLMKEVLKKIVGKKANRVTIGLLLIDYCLIEPSKEFSTIVSKNIATILCGFCSIIVEVLCA